MPYKKLTTHSGGVEKLKRPKTIFHHEPEGLAEKGCNAKNNFWEI
ncbi:MAG: hypothetical protein QXJ27_04080 [Thermoplasmata archaeon]